MSESVSGEGDTTSMATVKPSKRKAAATTLGSSEGPHTRRRVDTITPKVTTSTTAHMDVSYTMFSMRFVVSVFPGSL